MLPAYDNLGQALSMDEGSPFKHGSEFRSTRVLCHIFKFHPLWKSLKNILDEGIYFLLKNLDPDSRKKDLKEGLKLGNHKGVDKYPEFFKKLTETDVLHECSLIIPFKYILQVDNNLLDPMNIIEQNSITALEEFCSKKILIHNQSKVYSGSKTSVSGRVNTNGI